MMTLEVTLDILDEAGDEVDTTTAALTEAQAQGLVDAAVEVVRASRNGGSDLFELVSLLDDELVESDLLEEK